MSVAIWRTEHAGLAGCPSCMSESARINHHVMHVSDTLKVNASTNVSAANGMRVTHLSPKVIMLIKTTG